MVGGNTRAAKVTEAADTKDTHTPKAEKAGVEKAAKAVVGGTVTSTGLVRGLVASAAVMTVVDSV